MRELRWLFAPLALSPALLPVFACSQAPVAGIGLVLRAPEGVLDDATSVKLSVADEDIAKCADSGHADIPDGQGQSFDLARTGCAAGVAWCKDIELALDDSTKTFAVVASSAAGVLGEGCTRAAVDQDPLEVAIKIQRYNPPACCNDEKLETGEQCECGLGLTTCSSAGAAACGGITEDDVCESNCVAKEIPLDRESDGAAADPGKRSQLSMAFCPGDTTLANALRAAYTDESGTTPDIGVRVLDAALYPLEKGTPLAAPRYLPLLCSAITAKGPPRQQVAPSLAPISSDVTAVVYASDEANGARFDIYLSPQSKLGCRDKMGGDPAAVQLNTANTTAESPDVAGGPSGSGLAVWTENNQIHGRIFVEAAGASPPWQLVPASGDIVIAQNGSAARVAGSSKGWIVVYQGAGDGGDIFQTTVDTGGVPGSEQRVNAATEGMQDQPDVALLTDGRSAVVWHSGDDVFFQRFDAAGAPLAGDQDGAIHKATKSDQAHPAIAGYGSFYAAAWENNDKNTIDARFLGADGESLYNSVSGQNGDFVASQPGQGGARHMPAVAIGGGGFVAIGWQDTSPDHPGLFVRRLPLPTK